MFDTILVANRGEIAARIIRTARRMGLKTVAVHSDADSDAPHVHDADVAVRLGPAPVAESYLRADAVLEAAERAGAGAIHPGYGFLAENAGFAAECERAGVVFVGPTAEQLRAFGDKHNARELARSAGVPLAPGSGLLDSGFDAVRAADEIGYPLMLKATGGGGGIGMQACADAGELRAAFDRVGRLAAANFGSTGLLVERLVIRARHVEVQVFGDGGGRVVSLGTRDCTLQRRHQKVVEEAPAPGLPDEAVERLLTSARDLAASVGYRSAGTVEYVYDVDRDTVAFLEMNTRLQVEHPVTEAITGVDLVEWMLRLAMGDADFLDRLAVLPPEGPPARGAAVEARVYAEDPHHDYRPSSGLLTDVRLPGPESGVRVDGWVETGTVVSPHYDPLLAKVVTTGPDRDAAFEALGAALDGGRVSGVATNLAQLRAVCRDPDVRRVAHTTSTLDRIRPDERRVDVLRGGVMTTVQDWPGRLGLWEVGIPPSGPMDDLSFRLANRAVGNPEGAPGLECTLTGPRLTFAVSTVVCVTGAPAPVELDGVPVPMWEPVEVPSGGVLDIGAPTDVGLRTYLSVRGGLDVPAFHGSRATFTLGGFGGHAGRALRTGDVLALAEPADSAVGGPVPPQTRPEFGPVWELAVTEGPQPAPDYFTRDDMRQFYETAWRVQSHANRTGIRLSGPKPTWARPDGGEAGLHPSNLHDNAYSVGSLNVSGDTPILLGPDGPSLGGFACPLTVVAGHRWKLGQIRPGDTVRFTRVGPETADALRGSADLRRRARLAPALLTPPPDDDGVLARLAPTDVHPGATYRRGGDDNILVEYGPMTLDLGLRMRVGALAAALARSAPPGLVDVTPGVRSLHLHADPDRLSVPALLGLLREIEADLPATADLVVPSRTLRLPMSFDDPVVARAVERYAAGVRTDAPWLPSNIEFIRRVNGLESTEDVRRILFEAEYLVLGLGDVYLGAPVAVPFDPRHRLVTTKYNPARTWTAADTVGIGGKYLCVYGMESPGGYQLVGRTVPIWSGHRQRGYFAPGRPWLLRFFDRISWYPVDAAELLEQRAAFAAGRLDVDVEEGTFALADHLAFLDANAASIAEFDRRQQAAFDAEARAWRESGEFDPVADAEPAAAATRSEVLAELPDGATVIEAPMVAGVWRVEVAVGDPVDTGSAVVTLEAMKLELPVTTPVAGTVRQVLVRPGAQVAPGQPLAVVEAVA